MRIIADLCFDLDVVAQVEIDDGKGSRQADGSAIDAAFDRAAVAGCNVDGSCRYLGAACCRRCLDDFGCHGTALVDIGDLRANCGAARHGRAIGFDGGVIHFVGGNSQLAFFVGIAGIGVGRYCDDRPVANFGACGRCEIEVCDCCAQRQRAAGCACKCLDGRFHRCVAIGCRNRHIAAGGDRRAGANPRCGKRVDINERQARTNAHSAAAQ